ncbi:MAG: precorrin-6A/cobalt-precorrin-6A reductase, partial [Spirochaetaceae bacterium]|nr:precorrin-6A/cobalt-precorrin-6A reductase [Spirochaetaceae bacterium]
MKKILVFGGTTEGRQTAEMLAENQIECDVCVATEYGEELLEESRFINVKQGRLAEPAMKELLAKGGYAAVIDATHPFATAVSSNIMQCMAESDTDIPLSRFEREISHEENDFCTY